MLLAPFAEPLLKGLVNLQIQRLSESRLLGRIGQQRGHFVSRQFLRQKSALIRLNKI